MTIRNAVTLLIYLVVNFVIAAIWHLVLFKDVLEAATPFTRDSPDFALGLSAMVVIGAILIAIYPRFHSGALFSRWSRVGRGREICIHGATGLFNPGNTL